MDRFPDEASGVLGLWCIRIPSKVWPNLYWRWTKLPQPMVSKKGCCPVKCRASQFKGNELVVDRGYPLCLVGSPDAWQLLLGMDLALIGGMNTQRAIDILALDLAKRGTDEYYWGEMPPFLANPYLRSCRLSKMVFQKSFTYFLEGIPLRLMLTYLPMWRYDPPSGEWLRLPLYAPGGSWVSWLERQSPLVCMAF